MGAAVVVPVAYGAGIVGVFSVVAGWFGGVFRTWNAKLVYLD